MIFTQTARANLKTHILYDCVGYESFIKQIMNCGDNNIAVSYASSCADRITKDAKANARELSALMKEYEKDLRSGQTHSQSGNMRNLVTAVEVLYRQITDMQRNTARVADYTLAMIDAPGSESAETSTECFNSAFNSLSDIVKKLDREIVNSIKARKQAIALLKTSGDHHGSLDSMSPVVNTVKSRSPASPKGPKGKKWRGSDISGTDPEKKE
jgi:hypothetical protein